MNGNGLCDASSSNRRRNFLISVGDSVEKADALEFPGVAFLHEIGLAKREEDPPARFAGAATKPNFAFVVRDAFDVEVPKMNVIDIELRGLVGDVARQLAAAQIPESKLSGPVLRKITGAPV